MNPEVKKPITIINIIRIPSNPINEGNFSMKNNRLGSYAAVPGEIAVEVIPRNVMNG